MNKKDLPAIPLHFGVCLWFYCFFGGALLRNHCYSFFLFSAPTTFRVPFSFASSPLSESLEQATRNVSLGRLCIN